MSKSEEPAITTATEKVRPNFRKKRLLHGLIVGYTGFWIFTAVAPMDRSDWFLESILALVLVGYLVATYRGFPLSDASYLLITAFLILQATGAHYTYSKVPLGFWFQETFDLSRNHYDRFVHFCFGLMFAYPIREVFLRVANTKGFWSYYLPLDVTVAFSALFEILEGIVVWFAPENLGATYLGTQGDDWDAQKDMACAAVGACLCMLVTMYFHRLLRKRDRPQSPVV